MQRIGAQTRIAREYRDVFELDGVPGFRRFYEQGVFVWKALYRGSYAPWHVVSAPTIANPRAVRQLYRLNLAKAAVAELAGLVWGEQCEVRVSRRGAAQDGPDPLDAFVRHVLKANGFGARMQQSVEQGLALGGAAVKVWYEPGRPDAEGIRLGFAAADQFVPLSWERGEIREALFVSREAREGRRYTRLEWHRRTGGGYAVDNELYRSGEAGGPPPDGDTLGARWPLEAVYPGLDAHTEMRAVDSLFAYWRTPIANNLDDDSPLGVSMYGNALETLRALDVCYDSFVQEFELGRKRIIVPARCVRTVADPASGEMRRYFDPSDRVYEALATDDAGELRIQDNSVELRVEEHIAALNAFLALLCLQLGFSANTFSFDNRGGLKTATEVVSENSKTYKTIRTVQNQLGPMLERLVHSIVDVAILYGVSWEGRGVEQLAEGGYDVKVVFDDGVTQDRQTNIEEGLRLVAAGLMSRFRFLTDVKYGQGLTGKEAEAELRRIGEEGNDQ